MKSLEFIGKCFLSQNSIFQSIVSNKQTLDKQATYTVIADGVGGGGGGGYKGFNAQQNYKNLLRIFK